MIAPRTVAAASPPPNSRATIDLSAISSRYVALTSDRDGVNFGSPAISGIRGAAIPTHPLQAPQTYWAAIKDHSAAKIRRRPLKSDPAAPTISRQRLPGGGSG